MALLVVLIGVAIALFGLAGVAAPQRIVDAMLSWQPRSRYYFAVGVRLAFGAAFLTAASGCRFSTVIFALGAIAVVVGVVLAPLGANRVDSMFQWWLHRPMAVLQAWFVAAIPFGAFVVYAGI